jgi:hypothetical protein
MPSLVMTCGGLPSIGSPNSRILPSHCDCAQQRRLTSSIGPEHDHHLVNAEPERDTIENVDSSDAGHNAFENERGRARRS